MQLKKFSLVLLLIEMNIWSSDSMRTVLKNLVKGLSNAVAKIRAVLACTKPIINQQSKTETGMPNDESVISSVSTYPNRTTPFFWSWLIMEILDEKIPSRQHRSNPRLVKKTRSKFPSKKPIHIGTGTQPQLLNFSIINTA
jgi:hypothetical protein